MGIFKTYDVRGIYGKEIDTNIAYRIGMAFSEYLKSDRYMVGYDARLHSQEMYNALIDGIRDSGANVTGIGLVSTPQLHFSQMKYGYGGAVMVTASHNPPEYHGFKFYDSKGGSVSYSKGLNVVEKIVSDKLASQKWQPGKKSGVKRGSFEERDTLEDYIDFIVEGAAFKGHSLKFIVDTTNGSAGRIFKRLIERLNLNATVINEEPDGNFPNHGPNPLKRENSAQLSRRVVEEKADFGAILDGDGDRVLFVDEHGNKIENYFLSALISEELLKNNPGASIVYDLIASKALPERIEELGGKPVVSRVGYTFIYDKMVETKAVFGSETSGHVYFKVTDNYYTESAAYALVTILNLLEERKENISKLVEPLKGRYYQSEEVNIEVKDKEKALSIVEERYKEGRISKLDGVSVGFPDFWFNVRPSNTEPVLRLRLEGRNKSTVESVRDELVKLLKIV